LGKRFAQEQTLIISIGRIPKSKSHRVFTHF
jgi:hypothetical protein